jgi:phosphoenolpyruvate synthase/pyruvate phosphate dikinase
MASPLSVNLDDIDEFSPAVAGNKAFYQALLRRHGINCPSGICITTAYFLELLNQNGPAALSNDRTAPFRARRALRNAVIGKNIEDDVRNFFNRINAAPGQRALCVRSSSPLEDAKSASFAGQFFSSCGLTNVEDAVSAIKSCYLSLYSDTALLYCQGHAISVVDLTMAVLVQEMINCDKFAVMFTRHPLTRASEFFVEATFGFGLAWQSTLR